MAERRMLSRKITDHDNFTSLPAAAQALYMHLVMVADDDGLNAQVNSAISKAKAKPKDLKLLVDRHYIIQFKSGVVAIKHWGMMNRVRQDRYHKTDFPEELAQLRVKPNGAYTLSNGEKMSDLMPPNVRQLPPNDGQFAAEVRLGKDSVGKDRLGKVSVGEDITPATAGNARAPARESEPPQPDPPLVPFAVVLAYYQDKINPTPSRICVDALADYTNRLGPEVVIHALGIALDERKTAWSYIDAILRRYVKDGLTNMDAVLQAEASFREEKPAQAGKKVLTFLDV